ERAVAAMVKRARRPARPVRPGRDDLEDEESVLRDHPRVDDPALEAGEALADQRRRDAARGRGRQAERGELVDIAPRRVAASDHLVGEVALRDVDRALARGL